MCAALTTHTEVTIAEGKKKMITFEQLIKVSSGLLSLMFELQHGCAHIDKIVGI